MPNLVPISQTASQHGYFLSVARFADAIASACAEPMLDAIVNVQRTRESWIPVNRAFDLSLPVSRDQDRPASVMSSPDTLRCVLTQWQRIAGIRGVSPLAERYEADGIGCKIRWRPTARGTSTRTTNPDKTGLPPSQHIASIDAAIPGAADMAYTARYRNEYRGKDFADAHKRAFDKRDRTWFTNAFPYWPLDRNGKPMAGRPTRDGKDRFFDLSNGERVYLSSLIAGERAEQEWIDDCADELRRLQAEQAEDMGYDRKHSKKTRMAY
jgi:hypothetical protein